MLPFFIWNGIKSDDLIINKLPNIIKAAKDITKTEVQGRDGFLTQDNGSYKSVVKSVECTIKDLERIDSICSWLTGSGEVIFSNEPTKVYKATIINQIEFKRVVATFHSFIIQFDCQPHKYDIDNESITLTTPGTLYNSGTAPSKPLIKIFGTGAIDLTINSTIINLTNVDEYVTIDTEMVDCYKDTLLKNDDMDGEFPILEVGINNISWTGTVTKVEIIPNWRYL